MPSERAPDPNGFTGSFYKAAWPVQPEIMAAIQAFVNADSRSMAKVKNALIVLLPKKVGTCYPSDFCPIAMIHSFAKLISKILALRLAPRLNVSVAKKTGCVHQGSVNSRQL